MRSARFLMLAICACASVAIADPMRPLPGASAPASAVVQSDTSSPVAERMTNTELKAIRRNASGNWEALLGTHWVHAGDRLKDARIVEVRSVDVVVLGSDGHRDVLSILPRLLPLEQTAGKATRVKP